MTKSFIQRNLKQKISTFAKQDKSVKILDQKDKILVNDKTIVNEHGLFKILNQKHRFCTKKSAVGYAVCMVNDNPKLANKILRLDNQYKKLTEDISWYNQIIRNTANDFRKITNYNRLSDVKPRLQIVKSQLKQTLKSVKIA